MKQPTGTREWSSESYNLPDSDGKCPHRCLYCYAKEPLRRIGHVPAEKRIKLYPGIVMFPTRHDITPENLEQSVSAVHRLTHVGNKLLIVTKPHLKCVEALCLALKYHRGQILWRFTIGSTDDKALGYWEPGAPKFAERVAALEFAFRAGFETSISMEPMLDAKPDDVICAVDPFVTDTIWLGRANKLAQRVKMNGGSARDLQVAGVLDALWNDHSILDLHRRLKHLTKIRWKDSIKAVVELAYGVH